MFCCWCHSEQHPFQSLDLIGCFRFHLDFCHELNWVVLGQKQTICNVELLHCIIFHQLLLCSWQRNFNLNICPANIRYISYKHIRIHRYHWPQTRMIVQQRSLFQIMYTVLESKLISWGIHAAEDLVVHQVTETSDWISPWSMFVSWMVSLFHLVTTSSHDKMRTSRKESIWIGSISFTPKK